jgi:hypothetical protein
LLGKIYDVNVDDLESVKFKKVNKVKNIEFLFWQNKTSKMCCVCGAPLLDGMQNMSAYIFPVDERRQMWVNFERKNKKEDWW